MTPSYSEGESSPGPRMHPIADRISPTRWGWIAVACGLESGHWLHPGQAAPIAHTDTATLRRWAHRGLISTIHTGPQAHYRYLMEEMETIEYLSRHVPRPSMALLCQLLNDALTAGSNSRDSRIR